MGTKYNISCKNCNHTFCNLREGIGRLYRPENVFISCDFGVNNSPLIYSILEKEDVIKKQVEKLMSKGAIPISYNHHLHRCASCNNLESKFYFCLKTSKQNHDEEYYEPAHHCSCCNNILELAEIDEKKIASKIDKASEWNCPKCGHFEIDKVIITHWD